MKKTLLIILMMIMAVTAQYAATFYVGQDGDPATPGYGTTITNPYPNFSTALNVAVGLLNDEDVTIYFNPGANYKCIELSNMHFNKRLVISGEERPAYFYHKVTFLYGKYSTDNKYAIKLNNCSNITVTDFFVSNFDRAAVHITDSKDITISKLYVDQGIHSGVPKLEHGVIIRNSSYITLENCNISMDGSRIDASTYGEGGAGFLLDGVSHCTLRSTNVNQRFGPGYYVTNSTDVTFTRSGYTPYYGQAGIKDDNKYIDARIAAFYFENSARIQVNKSTIYEAKYGISTYDVYDLTENENMFYRCGVTRNDVVSPEFEAAYYDFEDGAGTDIPGWVLGTSTTCVDERGMTSDDLTLRVDSPLVTCSFLEDFIPVEPDTLYQLSGYITVNTAYDAIYLDLNDGKGQGGDFVDQHAGADGDIREKKQYVSTRFRTGPATTGIKVRVVGAGLFWVDTIMVKKLLDIEVAENLGFEYGDGRYAANWTEGWQSVRTNELSRSGDFSLKVGSDPITSTDLKKLLPVESGKTYILKGYVYIKQANSPIYFDFLGTPGSGGTFGATQAHANLGDEYKNMWQPVEISFSTGDDTTQLAIRVVGSGEFFVDDISVTPF